jgi:hypothetical protein
MKEETPMNKKFLSTLMFALLSAFQICGQEIVQDEKWIYLKGGQSALGVEFRKDSTVFFNGKLLMGCNHMEGAGDVYLSRPSPNRGLSLVRCVYDDKAYIVDTKQKEVISKDIVPQNDAIGHFASWSPDEKYFISVKGGEDICIVFFILDLSTLRSRELRMKDCGGKLETNDFDEKNFSWINNKTFQVRMDILCNAYEAYDCDREKVIRSYEARVNVLNAIAAYGTPLFKALGSLSHGKTAKNVAPENPNLRKIRQVQQTKSLPLKSVRQIDFKNFSYPVTSDVAPTNIKTVRVRKGRFLFGKRMTDDYWEFEINSIAYGDLTNDSAEEAVISATSNFLGANPANSVDYDYYVYTSDNGNPRLIAQINYQDLWSAYTPYENENDECDGWIWSAKPSIQRQRLVFTLFVGGRHCVDKGYDVTLNYQWDGLKFVLTGKPIKKKSLLK